jgi:glycosyltransferase involved in cell wall biosynthesis
MDKKTVIMVANRIEGKKGILPVAIAAADAGLKFILVGAISDRDYFFDIMQTGNVEFHEQVSDEELRKLYYRSTIHVCNSVDGFESGTMPILEAMLCGVPVITRKIGHVPELNNGENMVINEADNEDVGHLTDLLSELASDRKRLEDIRQAGWNSAKVRSFERRAYQYQKLYRQVLFPNQTPVSIVVPVYDKPEIIRKTCVANI